LSEFGPGFAAELQRLGFTPPVHGPGHRRAAGRCDRDTVVGRRDYVVILLLVRLARVSPHSPLGGDEVAALSLVDETFVVAPPAALRSLCDERSWARWFPHITVRCTQDRGDLGKRWTVSGELVGSGEVWLQPYGDGVIVHVYLRVDWSDSGTGRRSREAARFEACYALPLKAHVLALKDACEAGRRPGEPRADGEEQVVSAPRWTSVRRIGGA